MRILWFSINPSLYFGNSTIGSWVESLERIVRKRKDCELAIAFATDKPLPQKQDRNVTYFPMYFQRSRFQQRYIDSYTSRYIDVFATEKGLEIINDFKPDIIHVFGSEWPYGLLAEHTNVPIVIHMQGMWPAYRETNLSHTATRTLWDVMHETWKPQLWWRFLRHKHLSKERSEREEKILSLNKHYMGRTHWDKAITALYSPTRQYFYCSEALRESFIIGTSRWKLHEREKCILVTVGNSDMIKGYDLTLLTAKLLNEHAPFDFEWHLIGAGKDAIDILKRKIGINADDVNVQLLGSCDATEIVKHLLESDIFMQTSWIDNSPNAVCEAQYVGIPVIATNVGGVRSLFDVSYDEDMLVPYDPYYLAAKIIELFEDKQRMQRLADLNYRIAHERHDDKAIERDLFACYETIINQKQI